MFIQQPFNLTGAAAGGEAGYVPEGAMWFDSGDGTELNAGSRSSDSSNKKRNIISVWRKGSYPQTASGSQLIGVAASDYDRIEFAGGGAQLQYTFDGGGTNYVVTSPALLRDPTAWQHLLISFDSTQASGSRVSFYYNGVLLPTQTYSGGGEVPADFESELLGNSITTDISDAGLNNSYFSEFIAIDGKSIQNGDVAISAFGTENSDGVWIPVDPTTVLASGSDFGNNGFYLDFADSSDFGNDVSGNNNDFTSSNTTTANWTYDRPADSSTDTGNYCTFNSTYREGNGYNLPLSLGNLTFTNTSFGRATSAIGTFPMSSGKWYWEISWSSATSGLYSRVGIGQVNDIAVTTPDGGTAEYLGRTAGSWSFAAWATGTEIGQKETDATWSDYYNSAVTVSDKVGVAFDADNGAIWISINGSWVDGSRTGQSSATVLASIETYANTYVMFDGLTDGPYVPIVTFDGSVGVGAGNFGQSAYSYTPPTGFNKLNTSNLTAPAVTKPSDHVLPILYEGNGGNQRVGNFIPFTDAYTVDNSCVFDSGDSDNLSRTLADSNGIEFTFSCWFKRGSLDTYNTLFAAGANPNRDWYGFYNDILYLNINDGSDASLQTSRLFKGPSAWNHILVSSKYDEGTTSDRIKLYINGVQYTDFSSASYPSNAARKFNENFTHYIGMLDGGNYYDGYMAEVVFLDGQSVQGGDVTVGSFGQTDTSTNRWIPKDVSGLTFGTNGFYLEFGTAADLGDDTSGNTNDWTENNIVAANQTVDTPTQNFTTLNPLDTTVYSSGLGTLSNGNRTHYFASGADTKGAATTISTSSGKWYWEVTYTTVVSSYPIVGILKTGTSATTSSVNEGVINNASNGNFYNFGTSITTGWSAISTGTVMMFALDQDNGALYVGRNGTWETVSSVVGVPDSGASKTGAISTNGVLSDGTSFYPVVLDSGGSKTTCNFGATTFSYPIGASNDTEGFVAIQQDNLAENTAGITGLSWIKDRDATSSNNLADRIRGIYYYLESDDTDNNNLDTNSVQRFLQQGVQVGNASFVNASGNSFVNWQWANDGTETTDSSSVGSIDCTYRANTTAGFSIGTYTGDGSAQTVAHGLGAVPKCIFVKKYSDSGATDRYDWAVYHTSLGNTKYLVLNSADAAGTSSTYWNNTTPISTVFTIGTNNSVGASKDYIFYAWAEVEGYSKFGIYEGNGVDDGPVINLGFRPSILIWKNIDSDGTHWRILDSARNPYNPINHRLYPSWEGAESDNSSLDFTANGFKIITSSSDINVNTIIYMAWAENPFGGSGVAQARAY